MKIVAIIQDESCEHLVVPDEIDLEKEYQEYSGWYEKQHSQKTNPIFSVSLWADVLKTQMEADSHLVRMVKKTMPESLPETKRTDFIGWLLDRGARNATGDEVIELEI